MRFVIAFVGYATVGLIAAAVLGAITMIACAALTEQLGDVQSDDWMDLADAVQDDTDFQAWEAEVAA